METISNVILFGVFLGLGLWLAYAWLRTHKHVKIKERMWSPSRILFAVAAVLALLTLFVMKSALDFARGGATIFCIVMFFLQRNGMGEDGVADLGKMVSWSEVKAYDYLRGEKKFTVYMNTIDAKDKKHETYQITQDYDLKDEDAVKELLQKQIGKKYRRMKKNG